MKRYGRNGWNVAVETGSNFANVEIGCLEIWFSYKTPIAFRAPGYGLVIRDNAWGPTTGKHLNAISDDKSKRIPGQEFEDKFEKCLTGLKLV